MSEENGMTQRECFGEARWMAAAEAWGAPLVRVAFWMKNTGGRARLRLGALGFVDVTINGRRLERWFQPVWSDYGPRDCRELLYPTTDRGTHSVYVLDLELTGLVAGENVLELLLGDGWYRQTEREIEGKLSWGARPALCFRLETGEGELLLSGPGLRGRASFVRASNVYVGERQDFAAEAEPYDWRELVPVDPPVAALRVQRCPADTVYERLMPKLLKEDGERRLYDAGRNVTGWATGRAQSASVTVRYAEELDEEKELDFLSAGGEGQIQSERYDNAPPGQALFPRFHWNGFRYFEVTGDVADLTVEAVSACPRRTAQFHSDDDTLNRLFAAYVQTQRNNLHAGVPSDCPHRERLGYTGDGQLVAETAMLVLDCAPLFEKWVRDILDGQDEASGHVQHTAPFYGGGGGPGGWGSAVVLVPWACYMHSGDAAVLQTAYPHMVRWLDCMETFCRDGLVVREYEGGWCLGDWCAPGGVRLPEPFVNTFYYLLALRRTREIAECLGEVFPPRFAAAEARSLRAWREAYRDPASGRWCDSLQGADAFALQLGEGDARTLEELCRRYRERAAFDTGIFGTKIVCEVLSGHGQADALYALLSSRRENTFGGWFDRGATTLWECWDGRESHDHPMFGACVKELFACFLGIRQQAPGRADYLLAPRLPAGLNVCEGWVETAGGGRLQVALRREQARVTLRVEVPVGVRVRLAPEGERPLAAGRHELVLFQ